MHSRENVSYICVLHCEGLMTGAQCALQWLLHCVLLWVLQCMLQIVRLHVLQWVLPCVAVGVAVCCSGLCSI